MTKVLITVCVDDNDGPERQTFCVEEGFELRMKPEVIEKAVSILISAKVVPDEQQSDKVLDENPPN